MGLFDPKCLACEKRTPKTELLEGYCSQCHQTLTQYVEVRDLLYKITGKTITLDPKEVVKMSEEDFRQILSAQYAEHSQRARNNPFITSNNFTLVEMRERGVKRVKYVTKGPVCECAECRARNGTIFPISDAIELGLHKDDAHKGCGKWLPVRERSPIGSAE